VDGVLDRGWLYLNALEPIAELGPDGAGGTRVTKVFVYGTLPHVPDYLVELDASGDPTRTLRIITDHLGSVRRVYDTATGALVQGYDYDTFGSPTLVTGTESVQPFGFAGGLYDADTGLVRFGARDYDAWTGRWTAKDPSLWRGGSTNIYAYVDNDPVNFIDPTGSMKLPSDPSGLGPEWVRDPRHRDPNGGLYVHPSGHTLEWNKGRPGLRGWRGKDHWHLDGDHSSQGHLPPGTEIPDFPIECTPDDPTDGRPPERTMWDDILDLLDEVIRSGDYPIVPLTPLPVPMLEPFPLPIPVFP
jgi:RHS repeat-associated protein